MEAQNIQQATGRRKEASAQVRLKPGSGKITVNGKPIEKHFMRDTTRMIIRQPLEVTNTLERFDIDVKVRGGGSSGQGGAVRHGISRALSEMDPDFHKSLKRGGFLTRDSRIKERKKYGRKKARKRFQYSKR